MNNYIQLAIFLWIMFLIFILNQKTFILLHRIARLSDEFK